MSGAFILASASASRRAMLEAAGLSFEVRAAAVDEAALTAAMAGGRVRDVAVALAETKAAQVSSATPGRWVVGGDSMLELEPGVWLDKPGDRAGLAAQLRRLSGRAHRLVSAVAAARDGVCAWRHVEAATLHVRPLSPIFIADYVAAADEGVLQSVGGYHLEGRGVQLFEAVEGCHFTVRGLPLIALLGWLRAAGLALA